MKHLWQDSAYLDQALSGAFYAMLPIIEHVAHVEIPDRETWIDAVTEG